MTPARFRWGLFLVLLGTLFLLRNMEVLNDNFWTDLLIYFPIVLIGVGIEKIFAKSKLQIISYLTSVFLFFGAMYVAFAGSAGGIAGSFFSRTIFEKEHNPSIRTLHAILGLDEIDLTIRDSGDELIYGRFDKFTHKPKIEYEVVEDEARVTFTSRSKSLLGGAIKIQTGDPQDWYVRFSKDVPLELECSGNSSDLHLNFSTTPLRNLELDTYDATIYLKLGDLEPSVKVDISGEDSKLRLRVPDNVGLMVIGEEYRSYLERIGLVERDGDFVNEGYDSLSQKIEVNLDDRLESLAIDFF